MCLEGTSVKTASKFTLSQWHPYLIIRGLAMQLSVASHPKSRLNTRFVFFVKAARGLRGPCGFGKKILAVEIIYLELCHSGTVPLRPEMASYSLKNIFYILEFWPLPGSRKGSNEADFLFRPCAFSSKEERLSCTRTLIWH